MYNWVILSYLKCYKRDDLLGLKYYRGKIKDNVYCCVENYYTCNYWKVFRDWYSDLFKPLSILTQLYTNIIWDFEI